MDPVPACGDREAVAAARGRRTPRVRGKRSRRRHRCGTGLERGEPLAQNAGTALAPQRFEPPPAVAVEVQQMVVERELELGQAGRLRRAGADRLQATAELVPEIAEPATADTLGQRI